MSAGVNGFGAVGLRALESLVPGPPTEVLGFRVCRVQGSHLIGTLPTFGCSGTGHCRYPFSSEMSINMA